MRTVAQAQFISPRKQFAVSSCPPTALLFIIVVSSGARLVLSCTTSSRTQCNPGCYQPRENMVGLGPCVHCPAGRFQSVSVDCCRPCPQCARGTWSNSGAASCTPCPAGKYGPNHGGTSSSCIACPAGRFKRSSGSFEPCAVCPAGSYTNVPLGASVCTQCSTGQFSANPMTPCRSCTTGQYQPQAGQPQCISCPLGSATDTLANEGATRCTECSIEYFSAAPNEACARCPPGSVTDSVNIDVHHCLVTGSAEHTRALALQWRPSPRGACSFTRPRQSYGHPSVCTAYVQ
jgi:hypothetical protein